MRTCTIRRSGSITGHGFATSLLDHPAKDFFYDLCCDCGRHPIHIADRVVLYKIGAHDLSFDGVQVRNRLADRHTSWFSMRETGREGGIKDIHIEGDVTGAGSFQLSVSRKSSHLDHFYPEFISLLALMSRGCANSYLHQ